MFIADGLIRMIPQNIYKKIYGRPQEADGCSSRLLFIFEVYRHCMENKLTAKNIRIRTTLKSGDIGYITWLHGVIYKEEYGYNTGFESIVAAGLSEFVQLYNPERNRIWICEDQDKMVACLLLVDRGETAQLRFFLVLPEYRGLGLGRRLMDLYMEFMKDTGYGSSYLWTTHELLPAISLYKKYGFCLSEEKESLAFGKLLREQKYEFVVGSDL